MRYLHLADKHDLPRIVTIQNPYSLLNRSYEVGLAEVTQYEEVELLAYSCSAWHADGEIPERNRPVRVIPSLAALPPCAADAESRCRLCGYREASRS
jgi:hypothetical protein